MWVADSLGAVLFAACLSLYLGAWADGGTSALRPWLLLGIIGSAAWRAGAQGWATVVGQAIANRAKLAQRTELFRALLPTNMQRGRMVGEDMRVAIDDVEAGENWVARFQPLRFAAVVSPLLIAAVVAWASWVAAAIMLLTLIPFGLGMALAGYAGKGEAERQLAALSRLSGLFMDRVTSLPLIVSNGAEERVTRQIGGAAQEVATRTMAVLRIAFVSSAVLEFFAALSVALVAVYCGFSLLGLLPFPAPETLNLGEAFFALALAPEFYLGMRRMAAAYHDKQQGEAAKASISAALAEASAFLPVAEGDPSTAPARNLSIKHLRIRYPDGTQIGPISADWTGPGLHILSGETGAGKSSVLHALMGLAPLGGGEIYLDNALTMSAQLVPAIGWAGQRPLLLPGTLADNLLLGAAKGDMGALTDMLSATGLLGLVKQRGADLHIDSRGSGLSGGERRRIGLVRAIASGRPILVLDEPTADLDAETAAAITAYLAELSKERLIIAATHDANLIQRANSVTVVS